MVLCSPLSLFSSFFLVPLYAVPFLPAGFLGVVLVGDSFGCSFSISFLFFLWMLWLAFVSSLGWLPVFELFLLCCSYGLIRGLFFFGFWWLP